MNHSRIAAFRAGRRFVAVAVFEGTRLDYTQIRHLASDHQKAEDSAVGFARWVLEQFDIESAVVENFADGNKSRRATLTLLVHQVLHSSGISIWKVGREELLEAFGIPPLKTYKELQSIAASFWPILVDQRQAGACMDAAALGLYVATERLFLT